MNKRLVSELLERNENGDNAVDVVLAMAENGDISALTITETALEHFSDKKLTYFIPGPRVQSGAEIYNSDAYERLLKVLSLKARNKTLLKNAAETQDEIVRTLNHIDADAGSFLMRINESGGDDALKIVQLLDAHLKVQARLIHCGVLEPRESIWENPIKKWWQFWK
jgi:hypothetical protein